VGNETEEMEVIQLVKRTDVDSDTVNPDKATRKISRDLLQNAENQCQKVRLGKIK
jgi:parvulin-like peptidyl-prolyl isomerase